MSAVSRLNYVNLLINPINQVDKLVIGNGVFLSDIQLRDEVFN